MTLLPTKYQQYLVSHKGSGGGAPSGVQGQSPWSWGQGGKARLKLKGF